MKPIPSILKYSIFLFGVLLFQLWLWDFSGLNIPESIPYTPIKINGILIVGTILTLLILVEKSILKISPSINVLKLTLKGALIGPIAEVPFQVIRSFTFEENRFYHFISGAILTSFFVALISFFVSFQLTTKNTSRLVFFIILFIVIYNVLMRAFPSYFVQSEWK